MMMNTTLNQLRSLRLETMAQALEQQLQTSGMTAMSFEERLALLVDREVHGRQDRRCARLLKLAKLKYPQAAIEDLDSRTRGIERSAVMSLALGKWVTQGHAKGDLLLQKVAARLKGCVRQTDTVARLGGGEFVVMLQNLGTDAEAAARKAQVVADKVLVTLREPYDLSGHQHYSTGSIGVTPFSKQQGEVSDLLKQADLAMYHAKNLGRNTVCFSTPTCRL